MVGLICRKCLRKRGQLADAINDVCKFERSVRSRRICSERLYEKQIRCFRSIDDGRGDGENPKEEERRNRRRVAGGHGEHLLEWFTNDSDLVLALFATIRYHCRTRTKPKEVWMYFEQFARTRSRN